MKSSRISNTQFFTRPMVIDPTCGKQDVGLLLYPHGQSGSRPSTSDLPLAPCNPVISHHQDCQYCKAAVISHLGVWALILFFGA